MAPIVTNIAELNTTTEEVCFNVLMMIFRNLSLLFFQMNDILKNVKSNVNKLYVKLKLDKTKHSDIEKVLLKPNGIGSMYNEFLIITI